MDNFLKQIEIENSRKKLSEEGNIAELKKTYQPYSPIASTPKLHLPDNIYDLYFVTKYQVVDQNTKVRITNTIKLLHKTVLAKSIHCKALIVGGGFGFEIKLLKRLLPPKQIYVIDIAARIIKKLQEENQEVNLVLSSVENIPFKEKTFDVIMILEVLEHFQPQKISSLLNELKRCLQSDGTICISVPYNDDITIKTTKCIDCGMVFNTEGHFRSYTPDLLKAELELNGLNVKKTLLHYFKGRFWIVKRLAALLLFKSWLPHNIIVKCKKA